MDLVRGAVGIGNVVTVIPFSPAEPPFDILPARLWDTLVKSYCTRVRAWRDGKVHKNDADPDTLALEFLFRLWDGDKNPNKAADDLDEALRDSTNTKRPEFAKKYLYERMRDGKTSNEDVEPHVLSSWSVITRVFERFEQLQVDVWSYATSIVAPWYANSNIGFSMTFDDATHANLIATLDRASRPQSSNPAPGLVGFGGDLDTIDKAMLLGATSPSLFEKCILGVLLLKHQTDAFPARISRDRVYGGAQHQPGWSGNLQNKIRLIVADSASQQCWRQVVSTSPDRRSGLHFVVPQDKNERKFEMHLDWADPCVGTDLYSQCVYGGSNLPEHLLQSLAGGNGPADIFAGMMNLLARARSKIANLPATSDEKRSSLDRCEQEWHQNALRWALSASTGHGRALDLWNRIIALAV